MGSKRARVIRNAIGIVCLVLAAFTAFMANSGVFMKRELYNSSAFAAHTDHLIGNPAVRESIASAITDELISQAPEISRFRGLVEAGVNAGIDTKQFREVFDRALSNAHDQIVAGDDAVTLDLGEATQPIVDKIAKNVPFASALVPELKGILVITVLTKAQAPELWRAVERGNQAARWSVIVTVLLLLIALAVIPNHWLAVAGAGGAVAAAAVIGFVSSWSLERGIQSAFAPGLEQRTYQAVYDEFSGAFTKQTFVLLLIGGAVLVIGVVGELVTLRMRHRDTGGTAAVGGGDATPAPVPSAAAAASAPPAAAPVTETPKSPPLLD